MWTAAILLIALAAGAVMAWAVRAPSSTLLAPTIWRGPKDRRVLALTFDDGPSESTPQLLDLLARYNVRATFFMVGHHVRRLPHVARMIVREGHEIGNHTDTHDALYLRSPGFIQDQIARAQESIAAITGVTPALFRASYGVRWFGLRAVQRRLGLTGVMWTGIANDWALSGSAIAQRLIKRTRPGAILCFHDGRELKHNPDIRSTIEALELLLPHWSEAGYGFETVSEVAWRASSRSSNE